MNKLLEKITSRQAEVSALLHFLETQTNWLTAPASTRFHLNVEGGLIQHCVGVAETLLRLKTELAPQISDESCVIVGLFHDTGKVGFPGINYYFKNTNEWEIMNRNKPYMVNPECVNINIATQSIHLISKFVTLYPEEVQAIAAHDGLYPTNGGVVNLEYYQLEEPLTLLLQFADRWTAAVIEEKRPIKER
ncbi:MAG: HD domain-containing protein [Candidatus Margulisbacteria bacterium]|nr:HD domain-containing protein [Candidatus Margulisiibacteriota bacterium]